MFLLLQGMDPVDELPRNYEKKKKKTHTHITLFADPTVQEEENRHLYRAS